MTVMGLEENTCRSNAQCAMSRGYFLLYCIERCLKLNLDRPYGGDGCKMLNNICLAIEIFGPFKRITEKLYILHAVHAKHAHPLAQAAVAHDIPVPVPAGDSVWFHLALRDFIRIAGVVDGDTSAFLNGFANAHQERG